MPNITSPNTAYHRNVLADIGLASVMGDRPALAKLITTIEKLPRHRRLEIADRGRRAKAAQEPRLRKLARMANAEARKLLLKKVGA